MNATIIGANPWTNKATRPERLWGSNMPAKSPLEIFGAVLAVCIALYTVFSFIVKPVLRYQALEMETKTKAAQIEADSKARDAQIEKDLAKLRDDFQGLRSDFAHQAGEQEATKAAVNQINNQLVAVHTKLDLLLHDKKLT